jgi:hypothetical protein
MTEFDPITKQCASIISQGDPASRRLALKILNLVETAARGRRIAAAKAAKAAKPPKPARAA